MDRLVVIGASAGAVDALHVIIATLPSDFPATVLVVRHIGPRNCGLPGVPADPIDLMPPPVRDWVRLQTAIHMERRPCTNSNNSARRRP